MSLVRRAVQSLKPYTPGEQPRGGGVVKLNTNENPYPPSPRVREVVATLDLDRLRRYPDPLCTALRERIAALHGCAVAQVFVGNGSDELLALCTRAFVEDDGSVGYFDPSYSLYPVLAGIRGVARKPVELGPAFEWPVREGKWRLPAGYGSSVFFFTNPNAPTGMQCPAADVAAFCGEAPGVVVLDEAYVDFARENAMDLARRQGNVIVARSFSKSFALAGLRVGYAVGPQALIEALFKVKDSYNVDAFAQAVALAALADMEYMRATAERIRSTRERLRQGLADLGHTVFPSEANFVWVKPRGGKAAEWFDALRRQNILVRHFADRRTAEYVRITVGTDAETDALLGAVAQMGRGTEEAR